MARVQGQVFKLYDSRFGGGSFRLENDQTYYNTRDPLPSFVVPGAQVEFEAGELKGKGRAASNITQLARTAPQTTAQTVGGGTGVSRDEHIRYQSARKDALQMVQLLLEHGAVKLGENVAKRAAIIEALTDKFTANFFVDIDTLGALDRVEPEEIEPEVPVAKPKAKAKAVVEPDEDETDDLP